LGATLRHVDPDFAHRIDDDRVHVLGWAGTRRAGLMATLRDALKEGRAHLGAAGVLLADEEHARHLNLR
jgi:hypothetical protein